MPAEIRGKAMRLGQGQGLAVTAAQEGFFALLAAAPDGAHGVDDVLGVEVKARGENGLTCGAIADRIAGRLQLAGTSRAEDSAADAATLLQATVGGIDQGIGLYLGDIAANKG